MKAFDTLVFRDRRCGLDGGRFQDRFWNDAYKIPTWDDFGAEPLLAYCLAEIIAQFDNNWLGFCTRVDQPPELSRALEEHDISNVDNMKLIFVFAAIVLATRHVISEDYVSALGMDGWTEACDKALWHRGKFSQTIKYLRDKVDKQEQIVQATRRAKVSVICTEPYPNYLFFLHDGVKQLLSLMSSFAMDGQLEFFEMTALSLINSISPSHEVSISEICPDAWARYGHK